MPDVTVLRRFSYRHEAEVVRSVLEGSGIVAFVTSDDCGSVDPALGMVRGVSVAVAEVDVERAEDVLAVESARDRASAPDNTDEEGEADPSGS
jgi:hypothetical protein